MADSNRRQPELLVGVCHRSTASMFTSPPSYDQVAVPGCKSL